MLGQPVSILSGSTLLQRETWYFLVQEGLDREQTTVGTVGDISKTARGVMSQES